MIALQCHAAEKKRGLGKARQLADPEKRAPLHALNAAPPYSISRSSTYQEIPEKGIGGTMAASEMYAGVLVFCETAGQRQRGAFRSP